MTGAPDGASCVTKAKPTVLEKTCFINSDHMWKESAAY